MKKGKDDGKMKRGEKEKGDEERDGGRERRKGKEKKRREEKGREGKGREGKTRSKTYKKLSLHSHPLLSIIAPARGISAAGSAPHWQCGGRGFESHMLHGWPDIDKISGLFLFLPSRRKANKLKEQAEGMSRNKGIGNCIFKAFLISKALLWVV